MRRRFITSALLLASAGLMNVPSARSQTSGTELWNAAIKNPLLGPSGQEYFENTVKGAEVPGGLNEIHAFRGTVLSSQPADGPSELVVAVSDSTTPEVTLRLRDSNRIARLIVPVPKGAIVYFGGVVTGFRADPFMLTMEVDIEKLGVARFSELLE